MKKKPFPTWGLLLAISTIYLSLVIYFQWSTFSITYPISEYAAIYSESQYVKGDRSTIIMGDGEIYTYAGIRYIQGEDPTQINFEHPPLIKYAFGLSYILFGMPNWAIIPWFFIAILSFWYISARVIDNQIGRWLALGLFLGHSTIYTAIPLTMLDFPMTALLLLTLAIFLSNISKPSVLKSLGFGFTGALFLLSKYPFPLSVILLGLLFIAQYRSRVSVKQLFLSFLVLISVYLIGYSSFFIHGHSLIDFIRFEWWRLHWFFGKTDSPIGLIWQTIFTGRFPKWWSTTGEMIVLSHWNILWPLSVLLFLFSLTLRQTYSRKNILWPYQAWIIIGLIAFTFGASMDRYLIPLIPGFALFGVKWIMNLLKKWDNSK